MKNVICTLLAIACAALVAGVVVGDNTQDTLRLLKRTKTMAACAYEMWRGRS